jgi:hypothetical protein
MTMPKRQLPMRFVECSCSPPAPCSQSTSPAVALVQTAVIAERVVVVTQYIGRGATSTPSTILLNCGRRLSLWVSYAFSSSGGIAYPMTVSGP